MPTAPRNSSPRLRIWSSSRPMISRSHPALLARLRDSGITVVSLQPTDVKGMFAYWQTLGDLTGRAAAAQSMRTRFLAGVAAIERKIPIADHGRRPGSMSRRSMPR